MLPAWSIVNFNFFRGRNKVNFKEIIIRNYSKKKKFQRKVTSIDKALNHFDDLYKGLFQDKWTSIRLGLLSKPKKVALLNNFGDIEETEKLMKYEGAVDLRILIGKSDSDFDATKKNENLPPVKEEEGSDESSSEDDLEFTDLEDEKLRNLIAKYKLDQAVYESFPEEETPEEEDILTGPPSMHEALRQRDIDEQRFIDPNLVEPSNALNEFVPVSKLKGLDDFILEDDMYRFYKVKSEIPVDIQDQEEIQYPEYLKVYSFPRCDISSFPNPTKSVNQVYNYYPLDGGSLLAVLALELEPHDVVLDMCAAPGGKSLAMLQTMIPEMLVANDVSLSRLKRLQNVFSQYILNYTETWKNMIKITNQDAASYESPIQFNKILVDVPCLNDRVSATEDENNIFNTARTKERLSMQDKQSSILETALRMVKPGGTVLYSTCTLSPVQNEGVVNVVLHTLWQKYGMEFTVRNLSPALKKMSGFYKFGTYAGLTYGSLVVPFVPVNFGPTYMCKLVKSK